MVNALARQGREVSAPCRCERKDLPSKPHDVPSNPNVTYGEFRERGGWGLWLGTGNVARRLGSGVRSILSPQTD